MPSAPMVRSMFRERARPPSRTDNRLSAGWRGANGFEIAEACARVALCVSRGGVEEVTYDLHDEFWFWWWGGTSE